jgi:hypothetical protein
MNAPSMPIRKTFRRIPLWPSHLLKTRQRLIAIEFAITLGLGGHTARCATAARVDLANDVAEYEADCTC